jgi:hypothetical protein
VMTMSPAGTAPHLPASVSGGNYVLGRAMVALPALMAALFHERVGGSRDAERPRSGAIGALDAAGRERMIGGRAGSVGSALGVGGRLLSGGDVG